MTIYTCRSPGLYELSNQEKDDLSAIYKLKNLIIGSKSYVH
jgi:hypothetical protein